MEHSFGGYWTTTKLETIDKYLNFYTTALKQQKFKLCYIDAFAGSGTVTIKGGETIDGSAIRALQYPFDKFVFFEKDPTHYALLSKKIASDFGHLHGKISLYNEDCNEELRKITSYNWIKNNWRGVIFLDPYAMQLSWEILELISETKAYDIWYLFPFSAVNRNLYNNGQIPKANKDKITSIFGTNDWETEIYKESDQLHLFDIENKEKINTDGLRNYILGRLEKTFPTVSHNAAILRNDKNSPVFLLCFAGSNPSPKAMGLSLKAADFILSKI